MWLLTPSSSGICGWWNFPKAELLCDGAALMWPADSTVIFSKSSTWIRNNVKGKASPRQCCALCKANYLHAPPPNCQLQFSKIRCLVGKITKLEIANFILNCKNMCKINTLPRSLLHVLGGRDTKARLLLLPRCTAVVPEASISVCKLANLLQFPPQIYGNRMATLGPKRPMGNWAAYWKGWEWVIWLGLQLWKCHFLETCVGLESWLSPGWVCLCACLLACFFLPLLLHCPKRTHGRPGSHLSDWGQQ